jgi:hypothetical protein
MAKFNTPAVVAHSIIILAANEKELFVVSYFFTIGSQLSKKTRGTRKERIKKQFSFSASFILQGNTS